MSPAELKTARHALGLSAQAIRLHCSVKGIGGRTVRRWESGDAPIPGLLPLFLHMRAVIAKLVPADFDQHPGDFMPEWHEAKKVLELPKSGLTEDLRIARVKDVEIDMWKPERLSVADMLGTSDERIHTDGGRALPRRRGQHGRAI